MSEQRLLSVVVPVLTDQPDLERLHATYKAALQAPGRALPRRWARTGCRS